MAPEAEALAKRIGANVARRRREAGYTLRTLAERAGLHMRHVQSIEHGKMNVTLHTLAKMASAFDVDPAELLRAGAARPAQRGPRRKR